ncbi:hypothetical protein [Prescottella equi]|uniref:hypothetical protein n=1 Tax=Rhodococcus hoagii TaxID=43767 RepID=UPI001585A4AE|nr:hypothetical protein [Prescottella equi]
MASSMTDQVAFPLRKGSDDELGRWKDHAQVRKLMRFAAAPTPELCVTHGEPATWSKRFRCYSRPTTDFDRKSRRSQLLHDFVFTSDRIFRQVNRLATAYSTTITTHGCPACRGWLYRRRARSGALLVITLLLLIAVPMALAESSQDGLVALSLFAGLGILVVTAASARWINEFARATVSEDGTRLIIDNPHPDYARTAVALGAERHPRLERTEEH